MEASKPSDTVEPCCSSSANCSCHPSRSVPVFGTGEGGFQPACLGKYNDFGVFSDPESRPFCSTDVSSDRGVTQSPLAIQPHGLSDKRLWAYYQNVRGVRTKIDELFLAAVDCGYDAVFLTETGLDESINSVQLFGSSFNVFRCDRNPSNSDKSSFGGVLIAVAQCYPSSSVTLENGSKLEQVCVSTIIKGIRLNLVAVYIPPDKSRDIGIMEAHIASVQELSDKADKVLVCGDYNQPRLQWDPRDSKVHLAETSSLNAAGVALLDGMDFLNLTQRNTIKNDLGRTLDLVFHNVDNDADIDESVVPLLPVDAHHPPLVISLPVLHAPLSHSVDDQVKLLDYGKIDYVSLIQFLSDWNWNDIIESSTVDEMTVRFCNVVKHWLESNVPFKRRPVSPAWSTPTLRKLKRKRNAAQRRLRRCKTAEAKREFKRASSTYSTLNCSLYKSYVLRAQWNLRRNPRCFWSFVNSKRKNTSIPTNIQLGEREAACTGEACELFAEHFASVFEACEASDIEIESAAGDVPVDVLNLSTFVVTEGMVIAAARKLKNSVSPGPDGIPAVVFRRCSAVLAKPLAAIFTRSFGQGYFPALWKQSFMFPVFKTGDRRDVKNYRGITSLSAASKLFEIILSEAVLNNSKSYVATDQHGFIPGRSVVTNLLEFTSTCITAMEQNTQVDVIYTDLKAAFDKIDHRILLRKLARLGASEILISWLKSYLTGRTLRVQLESRVSKPFTSTSGVPQGSNLGPLLFTLFFNDVSALLGAKVKLVYADDLKLYLIVRTAEDCHRLQYLLDLFVDWCRRNKLIVSIPKCAVMTFHRNKDPILFNYYIDGTLLRRVDRVNDLGVLLDPKLDFHLHHSSIISKANRQLGFISKIAREFKDPHCLKALYCSLVRPILENASIVWCPYEVTWILRLEGVQKRFVRLALRNLPWRDPVNLPPYPNRCLLLDLETLERRRRIQQATFVAKLLNGEVDCPELLSQINFRIPQRSLRSYALLQPRNHRTAYGYHEPLTAIIRVFTSVESVFEFGEPSLKFRNRLRRL